MASQAQIDANRRNAQRSTGPRTAAGKEKVALNALAHGLTAIKVVAGQEDRPLFEALRAQLQREWRPGSILEVMLLDRIAELLWQLRRVAGVEVGVIENMPRWRPAGVKAEVYPMADAMARDFAKPNPTLLRVQMYQGRLERALHRALAELRRLQIERQMQDERDEILEDEAAAIAVPLPGERLGEGMQSEATALATTATDAPLIPPPPGEVRWGRGASDDNQAALDAPRPHPASPGGGGAKTVASAADPRPAIACPTEDVLPSNLIDKTNPISPATFGPAIASANGIPPADGAQTSDKRGPALRCPHGGGGDAWIASPQTTVMTQTA